MKKLFLIIVIGLFGLSTWVIARAGQLPTNTVVKLSLMSIQACD